MSMTEIVLKVLESNPDAKAFRFKTRTVPKLTRKSRATGEPTAFTVEIRSEFSACLGVNYQDEVNQTRVEIGLTPDFRAGKPFGKHYVNGTNWLMEADNAPGKFYIALSRFSDRVTRYFKDGVECSPEEIGDLRANYLPKTGPAPVVEWRTYSVESVESVEPVIEEEVAQ